MRWLIIFRWSAAATVTLIVGKAKTAFLVHESELFEASSFFKAAFTSDFRESWERTMTLPEDDESAFELFIEWVYHPYFKIDPLPIPTSGEKAKYSLMQPVQLYILADKYDALKLKNAILSEIYTVMSSSSKIFLNCPELIAYVYAHTSPNSSMRRMFADFVSTQHAWIQRATNQAWLQNHPDVSTAVNVSFAKHAVSRTRPFERKSPEDYLEKPRSLNE